MMNILGDSVSPESFLMVLVCLILAAYFVYKEWPDFKKRVSGSAKREAKEQSTEARLCSIEGRLDQIDEKLRRDFDKLNAIEARTRRTRDVARESLEERRVVMQALLGVIRGLQEIGANGPTKEAESMLIQHLNDMAHDDQEID